MPSKPRPSLLDLFDPLLAKAVNVPIPESPPTTPKAPQRDLERGMENKENLAPNEITMSVFFNRISRTTCSPLVKVASLSSGPLVELEDTDDRSEGSRSQALPRLPLTELSPAEVSAIAISPFISSHKRMSPRHPKSSETTPLPPSPLRQTQLAFLPLPAISVNGISSGHDDTLTQATQPPIDLSLSETIESGRGCMQMSSNALMPPNSNHSMHKRFHGRSSIDTSTNLSSLSSSSLSFQDASFDLVNGEISFLSRSLEDAEVDHDFLVDSLVGPQTPRAKTTSQTMNQLFEINTPCTQPTIGKTENRAEMAHSEQMNLSTPSSAFTSSEHPPKQDSKPTSTLYMGRQSTPPGTRRVSSVPAPTKKVKVFTSKHHRTANTSAQRGTVELVTTRSGTNVSAKLPKDSAAGSCATYNSGIPRGSAGRRGDTKEKCKQSAASGRSINFKVPVRTVDRTIETSALHKGESMEQASRIGTVSRLPGPAVARIGMVPSERLSKLPELTHRGRSDVMRSKPSKQASHTVR